MKRRSVLAGLAALLVAPYEAFIGDVEEAEAATPVVRPEVRPVARQGQATESSHVLVEFDGMRYEGQLGRWSATRYKDGMVTIEVDICCASTTKPTEHRKKTPEELKLGRDALPIGSIVNAWD